MGSSGFASAKMLAGLIAAAWLTSIPVAGQTPASAIVTTAPPEWKVARTPWGHPDLQGVWTTDAEVSVPLERSLIDGRDSM